MKDKINVLYLCEGAKLAGAERYAATLIKGLTQYDDINIVCGLFYEGFYFYKGLLRDELERCRVRVINLHGHNNLKSIQSIRRIVRDDKIGIIHFTDLKSTVVGGIASIFLRGVKTVATLHGRPERERSLSLRIKNNISLVICFFLLRFIIDRVICVSGDLGATLKKLLGSKVRIIHNGLEIDNQEPQNTKPSSNPRPYIVGTVGRLEKVKGLTFLLKSARGILDLKKDILLYIVGAGPLEKELKDEAKLLGISDKVRFLGFRPDGKSIIACMDIFVLSSLHEGIPYVLLEAMSLSKPVVCTEVGGIKEVIENQVDGLLVPPENPQALSHGILELLGDPGYAAELGRNARRKIETCFSSVAMAEKTKALYSQLLKKV